MHIAWPEQRERKGKGRYGILMMTVMMGEIMHDDNCAGGVSSIMQGNAYSWCNGRTSVITKGSYSIFSFVKMRMGGLKSETLFQVLIIEIRYHDVWKINL